MSEAYSAAGVDVREANAGVAAIVSVLRTIETGRPSLTVPLPGHYASVMRIAPNLGIALATDSVGSKVILAESTGRFDTIGIDCVAMNVNDLVCVGAEPLAMLDYLAVESTDPALLGALARGLAVGASEAGVEIPGGEVCQIPEVLRGHPSPYGFDLVGSAFGTVALDRIVDGASIRPGDAILGLPASGVHANGLTLARRALLDEAGLGLDDRPPELGGGRSIADELLEPTRIYVRSILALLRSDVPVHGLAHITGGGLTNLLRLSHPAHPVGYAIARPLPVPPVYELIARHGGVSDAEMWHVFNMGCGFCVVVPESRAYDAAALLEDRHPGTTVIGTVTDRAGEVTMPGRGLVGDRDGLRAA